jgi:putative membrane protein
MIRSSKAIFVIALPTFLVLSGVSLTQAQEQYGPPSPAPHRVSPDSADRALVTTLSKADHDEIAMSRSALPSLKDPDVKRFAQLMIDDHTSALSGLTMIASRLHYPLAPDPMGPMGTGVTTDAQFVASQITDHEQLLGVLPTNDQMIKDPGLRTHLADTRRAVQSHLDRAKNLQTKLSTMSP